MTRLYLTEQGSYLRKRGGQLVYEKDGETLLERPMREVGSVALFGAVQVSVPAMLSLLEKGCDVSLLTAKGHFRGRIVPALGANSPLRVKQHKLCMESGKLSGARTRTRRGNLAGGVQGTGTGAQEEYRTG